MRRLFNSVHLAPYFECETLPGAEVASDDELLNFARKRGNTGYYLVGTCRMGPVDAGLTVVDSNLSVHGVQNLRVMDASIMPDMVSGNLNVPTIMLAEKLADVIRGSAPLRASDAPFFVHPQYLTQQR